MNGLEATYPAGPAADALQQPAAEHEGQFAAELDVVLIGGGIAGLATAVALHTLNPAWRLKVFEKRPAPRDKYGGSCRLEPNGLNAAEAISPRLLRDIMAHATLSKTILMHDTEGEGRLVRL